MNAAAILLTLLLGGVIPVGTRYVVLDVFLGAASAFLVLLLVCLVIGYRVTCLRATRSTGTATEMRGQGLRHRNVVAPRFQNGIDHTATVASARSGAESASPRQVVASTTRRPPSPVSESRREVVRLLRGHDVRLAASRR
jgi:hypothetical protein